MLLSLSGASAATPIKPSVEPPPLTFPPAVASTVNQHNQHVTAADVDFLPAKFSAKAAMNSAPPLVDVLHQAPVQVADTHTAAGSNRELAPVVEHFLEWLKVGVGSGHLSCNQRDSLLHVVPEGLGFMSPQIYYTFVEERADLSPLFTLEPSKDARKNQRHRTAWSKKRLKKQACCC